MPEALVQQLSEVMTVSPLAVALRLIAAMIFGGFVVLIYRRTRSPDAIVPSFTTTLVLLAILIATVTQVIGDNVARAFSLVGALSIVRFRTVVRDTQDTAYVIFAVVVGMAAGAGDPWLGAVGLGVVACAAYLTREEANDGPQRPYSLKIRVGIAADLEARIAPVLDSFLSARRLKSVKTSSQGPFIDAAYDVALRYEAAAEDLARGLQNIDGVQSVHVQRRDREVG